MTQNHVPFRYDYVGSFLRPKKLKVAREKFQNNEITQEELKKVEDYYILDLIEKQKKAGYHTITDGEFRRGWWHLDFFWGLNGISFQKSSQGLRFHDEETKAETAVVVGKISGENHPFVEHFKFVKAHEDENTIAKQTIPSPAQLLIQLRLPEFISETRKYYPTDDAFYADRAFWKIFNITEESLRLIAEEEIEINNAAIANHPEDMVITTHVCRGNFHSTYASEGAYDPIAPYLFAREDVDAFYLEYDDARSGGFEPLKYIPEGKKVVLGLITTKSAELEDKNRIIRRIHDAARYVPLENLYLSPQCGFASTEEGNKLTEEEQWAKLALVKDIAKSVWVD